LVSSFASLGLRNPFGDGLVLRGETLVYSPFPKLISFPPSTLSLRDPTLPTLLLRAVEDAFAPTDPGGGAALAFAGFHSPWFAKTLLRLLADVWADETLLSRLGGGSDAASLGRLEDTLVLLSRLNAGGDGDELVSSIPCLQQIEKKCQRTR